MSTIGLSFQNSELFNAMMYPFTRMTIYGTIWYQGNEYPILVYKFIF